MAFIVQFLISIFLYMTPITFYDFSEQENLSLWRVQNDTVMGGRSSSQIVQNEAGNGVFEGAVSLENNGGFAMVRYRFDKWDLSEFSKVLLRIKGDGKRYQFRIKHKQQDQHSYIHYFETSGEWETISIPLDEMDAQFRGRKLDLPNFDAKYIEEIAFFIGNKKAQDFTIEIDKIMFE